MNNIIRDLKELTPRMFEKVTAFLEECHNQGVMCYVFESYRSQERQDDLYAQGRTKPGNKVTWTLSSRHKQREAADFAFGGDKAWHWNGDWDKMIEIAKNFGLESLAPREKAHLQDDGSEYNNTTMKFEHNYIEIMKETIPEEDHILVHENKETEEEQLKALLEIVSYRTRMKIKKQIT